MLSVLAVIDFNVTTLIVAILSGGFITGVIALLRFRVDKDSVIVTSAQGAVTVQTGVIEALNKELERVNTELDETRAELKEEKAKRLALEKYRDLLIHALKELNADVPIEV